MHAMLDKSLIGIITQSETQNGYYLQSEKIINLAKSLVFTAIGTVVGTRISFLYVVDDKKHIEKLIKSLLGFILFMGVGLSFGLGICADNFVPLFFGEGFEPVIPILKVMAPVITVIGISNCLETHYYIPSGNRRISTKFLIAGAVLNIIGNLILIPRYEALGAAISTLLTEIIVTGLYIIGVDRDIRICNMLFSFWKIFIAGILMYSMGWLIKNIFHGSLRTLFFLQMVLCSISYIVIIAVFNIKEITKIINRKSK